MPLTEHVPKPMAPFGDSTLINDGISKLRSHIDDLHVTVGYKAAILSQHHIELGVRSAINTEQQTNSWWIYHSLLRWLDEPLFVLTCDNVTDIDFDSVSADYFDQDSPPCMVVGVKPVDGLAGDYIRAEGTVVTNLARHEPSDLYCSGIQVLNPAAINRTTKDKGDFYAVWRQLIDQRQLRVSRIHPTSWFSVDTIHDLERLKSRSPR